MREYCIDEKRIKSGHVLESIKKELSLLDVMRLHERMEKDNWTQAELLANEFNFQNLDQVKSAFDKLLNIDIFAELKNYKLENKTKTEHYQLDKYFDVRIKKILELRHSIVHDINFRKKISYNKIVDIYNDLHFFVDMFDFYLRERFLEKE